MADLVTAILPVSHYSSPVPHADIALAKFHLLKAKVLRTGMLSALQQQLPLSLDSAADEWSREGCREEILAPWPHPLLHPSI